MFNKDIPGSGEKKKSKSSRSKTRKEKAPVVTENLPVVAPTEELTRPDPDMATQPLSSMDFSQLEVKPIDVTVNGTSSLIPQKVKCQQIEAAFASHVGMIRDNNEDSLTVFMGTIPRSENVPEQLFGFFAVADGMGGHENGEVASNIAIRTTSKNVVNEFYLRALSGLKPGSTGETPGEILVRLIENTNQLIIEQGQEARHNMGTTLTCIIILGSMAYVGHIGDSRLYGVNKETRQLQQITKDHSLVARLVEAGALTAQEALDSPQRSVLYRSLGQRLEMSADTDFFRISEYTHLVLCSDGLWDMLPDMSISYIINKYDEPATICQELINSANSAGGEDNVSVIVIKL
ncbi:MAG: serine/threonine-protein phosphatase [Chloroflexi bacterium]|uniref:Protein phosphatase 2C domain-containing protein n=1 Tax=Candidatus Chlorohelix allophototropha TaxID=3003348 RepID=A0A8T7M897_9CHLR|nr:serine/threonine-protein phosphatase [Chloroflexota bacterium]WJW68299.1 protein phosphatase 2C domain-containing protein [Chloroflexota bacterium L227-S17]